MKLDDWDFEHIKYYLETDIKPSIQAEVGVAINGYTSHNSKGLRGCGFFSIPRLLFPEIDNLGSFITGTPNTTTLNIYNYLNLIMSQIDQNYSKFALFLILIFRNGLLHTHQSKHFIDNDGKWLAYEFHLGSLNLPVDILRREHLTIETIPTNNQKKIIIDFGVFYQDVISSIDIFTNDIEKKYIHTFNLAMKKQQTPLTKESIMKEYKSFDIDKELSFLDK